jgi:glycosyltransferase involved in cell wall biosynthesis
MNKELTQNDLNDPLVSILIYNYDRKYLRQCMDSIFHQDILVNFEIILVDDGSSDGSWETALEYSNKYPGIMSIKRNRKGYGPETNLYQCRGMAKGRYCVHLTNDQAFLPEYIKSCVKDMKSDPYVNFSYVCRLEDSLELAHSMTNEPFVSILCYNYNYGRYLRQCLESVVNQTYKNIQIVFSDNASTDESWDIAIEYASKYPGLITIIRNRKNFGSDVNFKNCWLDASGKYYIQLCSDDALMPGFVRKCVDALEAHPNAGYAMVHRTIIDENGKRTEEPPFYNQSCVIPGREQAAVYMLAAVNPCISQVMYRIDSIYGKSATGGLAARWYGNRILDFNLCCEFDMVYLKEPLLMHRLHSQNDSFRASENLLEVIGPYILQHQFADTASNYNLKNVVHRLPQAIEKLSNLCLRYCVRSLCSNNERAAQRYFHLAIAIMPQITSDKTFKTLEKYWRSGAAEQRSIIEFFTKTNNLATRSVSYDPPPGNIPIV